MARTAMVCRGSDEVVKLPNAFASTRVVRWIARTIEVSFKTTATSTTMELVAQSAGLARRRRLSGTGAGLAEEEDVSRSPGVSARVALRREVCTPIGTVRRLDTWTRASRRSRDAITFSGESTATGAG